MHLGTLQSLMRCSLGGVKSRIPDPGLFNTTSVLQIWPTNWFYKWYRPHIEYRTNWHFIIKSSRPLLNTQLSIWNPLMLLPLCISCGTKSSLHAGKLFLSLSLQRKYSRQSGVKETLIIYAFDVSIDYQHRRQGVKPLV